MREGKNREVPAEYLYIKDLPEIKKIESEKVGHIYTIIMVGVAAEMGTIVTLNDIYETAKERGYFPQTAFPTVYASVKSAVEESMAGYSSIKNFIYKSAQKARQANR